MRWMIFPVLFNLLVCELIYPWFGRQPWWLFCSKIAIALVATFFYLGGPYFVGWNSYYTWEVFSIPIFGGELIVTLQGVISYSLLISILLSSFFYWDRIELVSEKVFWVLWTLIWGSYAIFFLYRVLPWRSDVSSLTSLSLKETIASLTVAVATIWRIKSFKDSVSKDDDSSDSSK